MASEVAARYDRLAPLYAERFLHALDDDHQAQRWLDVLIAIGRRRSGPVLDVGCGPGRAVAHLAERGISVLGCDASAGQLQQDRHAFADLSFHQCDLGQLPFADDSLGGIVSHYSIIHHFPGHLDAVFAEWSRVLEPGAAAYCAFFGSRSAENRHAL